MRRQPGGQRRRSGLRAAALLLCLLALTHRASAQGIFELLTGPTPGSPATGGTASPAPVTGSPAPVTASPAPVSDSPAPVTASPAPVTASPAPVTASPAPVTASPAPVTASPAPVTASPAPVTGSPAPATGTASPAPVTTSPAPVTGNPAPPTTSPAPATGTASPAPVTASPAPATATPTPATPTGSNVTAGTPPVNAPVGSDAGAVVNNGTVGTTVQDPVEDVLPPAPPAAWQALQKDIQIVFEAEIRGAYIVPFTSPKAAVLARVLRDRYLRSCQLPDISVATIRTFTYLSFDSPATNSTDPLSVGRGRRLLGGPGRDLLQVEKSGAELRITVATASVRVDSEIASFSEGVDSGSMARDFSIAGIQTDNITLFQAYTQELIGPGNVQNSSSNSLQGWVIAAIVGAILLVLPAPLFLLVRWRKRRNKEAAAIAEAEAEAARQRMQSRMMRPGSKSFALKPGGGAADIMVRSGSVGGLAGFHNNGRLQSWSGSPERQYGQYGHAGGGQYAISRQTSVTSMGSAMPSGRSFGAGAPPPRVPSLPGVGRSPYAGPMGPPPGAYEEEVQAARTARSQRGDA